VVGLVPTPLVLATSPPTTVHLVVAGEAHARRRLPHQLRPHVGSRRSPIRGGDLDMPNLWAASTRSGDVTVRAKEA